MNTWELEECGGWTLVSRILRGTREPWVWIGPSALLNRIGLNGKGLYAAKKFKIGDLIGKYSGRELGRFHSETECDTYASNRSLSDMVLMCRVGQRESGFLLIDGSTGCAPYLQYVNDAKGTGKKNNSKLTSFGNLYAQSTIEALEKPHMNIQHELCFSYGRNFWKNSRNNTFLQ